MNRDDIRRKLDVDGNGKVNADDVLALFDGNFKKAVAVSAVLGAIIGAVVVKLFGC